MVDHLCNVSFLLNGFELSKDHESKSAAAYSCLLLSPEQLGTDPSSLALADLRDVCNTTAEIYRPSASMVLGDIVLLFVLRRHAVADSLRTATRPDSIYVIWCGVGGTAGKILGEKILRERQKALETKSKR